MVKGRIESNDESFRANRFDLVSRLADDLAHEIKNPLNAIVINLEVLKVRVTKGDAAAALDRAGVIQQEAQRLHGLVDRVLQLLRPSRDEAGSMALDQVLDEVLPLFEAQVRLARNQFSCVGGTAVYVAVARDAFKFALLNVLTAMHERLGEGDGEVVMTCENGSDTVTLTLHAVSDRPLGPADAIDRAVAIAAALLSGQGATASADAGVVTITLPRGT